LSDLESKKNKIKNTGLTIVKKIFSIQEVSIIIPVLALLILATIINPMFVHPLNLAAIARRMSMWGLVAIGEALIILTGNFDVSVGAMVAFICVFFSAAGAIWQLPLIVAILLSILLAITMSTISGFCIVKLKINPILTTIAMAFICRGLSKALTNAHFVVFAPAKGSEGFLKFGQAEPLSLSWNFFIFIAFIIIFQIILKKTDYGRKLYATGDNSNVARLAGINTDIIKISTFIISGTLIGIASVLLVAKEAVGSSNYGTGWEILAIAAVAIAGISLVGGAGSMIGLLIGVIMMQCIYNILILLQINQHMQSILLGVIMILSVIIDLKRRNRILGSKLE